MVKKKLTKLTGFANPTIGIITALPKEYAAVRALLNSPMPYYVPGRGAGRRYMLGEVPSYDGGIHFIALVLADMGNNIAATRATLLLEHFPTVNSIIMVGIAGGVPNPAEPEEHVRLGDIVVSDRRGVVQYDFDKETIREVIHRHPPRPPSAMLLEGVRLLEADEDELDVDRSRPWISIIDRNLQRMHLIRPEVATDILVSTSDPLKVVDHPFDLQRINGQPRLFHGPIASANKLLKNPVKRDQLRDMFGVKAVEMESSGIADAAWNAETGYLVVRGICDYCDSNKGNAWQKYAAIVAAAYTRTLLESMPSQNVFPQDSISKGQADVISQEDLDNYIEGVIYNLIPRTGIFIGRKLYKEKVLKALNSKWPIVIINGIGGIGKTALAAECAYDISQHLRTRQNGLHLHKFRNIVWISARERDIKLNSILDLIARALKQPHLTTELLETQLLKVLELIQLSATLVIVDNYEGVVDRKVDDFLKRVAQPGKVLITSRVRLQQFDNAKVIPLGRLTNEESKALIRSETERLGVINVNTTRNEKIKELISTIGGVPLALRIAVGLATEGSQSLEAIIASIKKGQGEIFENLFGYMWDTLENIEHQIWMCASLFPAPPDRLALSAASGLDITTTDKAISSLLDLPVLEPLNLMGDSPIRFSMHPLTRVFGISKIRRSEGLYAFVLRRIADYFIDLSNHLPKDHNWTDPALVLTLDAEDMQIMVSLIDMLQESKEWERLLKLRANIWFFLTIKGYWTDRVHIDKIAISAAEELGDQTIKPWVYVHTFSFIAFKQGATEQSAKYCEEGLKLFEELGDEKEISFCNVRLGLVAQEQKDYAKAEKLLMKALEYAVAVNDEDKIIWILSGLGEVFWRSGIYEKGREYFAEGLEIARRLGWPVRIGQLNYKLANTFMEEGNLRKAEDHLIECIDVLDKSAGSHADVYSRAKLNLAVVLYRQGELNRSRRFFNEAKRLLSSLDIHEEYIKNMLQELNTVFDG